ncbi:hypothetical protein LXL81_00590 [Dyadobacter sp. CY356]|nr:hypothetical protein [Dyadobacter sp. CY356]
MHDKIKEYKKSLATDNMPDVEVKQEGQSNTVITAAIIKFTPKKAGEKFQNCFEPLIEDAI